MTAIAMDGEPVQLVTMLPTLMLIDALAYQRKPSGLCLQVAHTLRHAYAWMGVPADIIPVELAVQDRTGHGRIYGNPRPRYEGDDFVGHCVLALPTLGRVIDGTVGQFPDVAKRGSAPILGRHVMSSQPLQDGVLPPGSQFVVPRADLILTYTAVVAQYMAVVYKGPPMTSSAQEVFYDNGLRVVAQLAAMLTADPEISGRARQTRLPQLNTILEAVTGATWEPSDTATDLFEFPDGVRRRLRDLVPRPSAPPLPPTAITDDPV